MTDSQWSGPEIAEALQRIGKGYAANLVVFRDSGKTWFVVTVNTDPNDEFVESAVTPGQQAKREHWQRENVVMSMAHDLDVALWQAEHRPMDGERKTLWRERAAGHYTIGPVAPRYGKSGRPAWARAGFEQPNT